MDLGAIFGLGITTRILIPLNLSLLNLRKNPIQRGLMQKNLIQKPDAEKPDTNVDNKENTKPDTNTGTATSIEMEVARLVNIERQKRD